MALPFFFKASVAFSCLSDPLRSFLFHSHIAVSPTGPAEQHPFPKPGLLGTLPKLPFLSFPLLDQLMSRPKLLLGHLGRPYRKAHSAMCHPPGRWPRVCGGHLGPDFHQTGVAGPVWKPNRRRTCVAAGRPVTQPQRHVNSFPHPLSSLMDVGKQSAGHQNVRSDKTQRPPAVCRRPESQPWQSGC